MDGMRVHQAPTRDTVTPKERASVMSVVEQQLDRDHAAGGALANRHLNRFVDVILTWHRWVIALARHEAHQQLDVFTRRRTDRDFHLD